MMRVRSAALAISLFAVSCCWSKETVYLKTGFSIEADSHMQDNQSIVFRTGAGTLQLPASDIERIEVSPDPPVVHPAAVANTVAEERPDVILSQAAYMQGVDEDLMRSVARVESGLHQNAISPKGAIGLMQLMPGTAAELQLDANRAAENALGGAKYLRELLIRYRGNAALALAAYNAGPGAVAKYGGVPPYLETQQYVVRVLREYRRLSNLRNASRSLPLRGSLSASKPSATN